MSGLLSAIAAAGDQFPIRMVAEEGEPDTKVFVEQ
jgi:hypothetical protein